MDNMGKLPANPEETFIKTFRTHNNNETMPKVFSQKLSIVCTDLDSPDELAAPNLDKRGKSCWIYPEADGSYACPEMPFNLAKERERNEALEETFSTPPKYSFRQASTSNNCVSEKKSGGNELGIASIMRSIIGTPRYGRSVDECNAMAKSKKTKGSAFPHEIFRLGYKRRLGVP
eukprot:TRINITY_DN7196_c0_g5_i1.p1 TRINITY_DN7196_c0_g5~~TRINITY_DN7196_c0_g5_i1.p1  ORF type:complete len:175 (-),score=19.78 TRINITY_DN7196_c0_g5_i1:149-673(-)